uniref:Uncharacterized protein n=1 Tax=Romanomermis culicivorax TaxID=13658 RepID=A0A915KIV8_ROMCU
MPPEKWYPSIPTARITAQIQPHTTDEMIIINDINCALLNFDLTILRQATAASQQMAQDFPDYFQSQYLRRDPHCMEELTTVLLSWMCDYYKYYGAENAIVITQLHCFFSMQGKHTTTRPQIIPIRWPCITFCNA